MRYLRERQPRSVLIGLLVGALVLFSCVATASAATSGKSVRPLSAHAAPTRELHNAAFTRHPGRQPASRPGRRALRGRARTMGILQVNPDEGVAGTPLTISGSHLAANANVELTWSTADATWLVQAKPDTVNYLGRSDTLFAVVLDKTTTDANGAVPGVTHGAPGLGWPARHLRRRQRRTGRSRRVHHAANRHRHADERPHRDADHDHLQRPRCDLVHGRGIPALGQPLRGRDDGQLDARRGEGDHPCRRAGGPAHDPDRQRHQLSVPERAAVADSVHERRHGHLHRDKGRRPAAFLHRLAGQRRSDAERPDNAADNLGRERRTGHTRDHERPGEHQG